MFDISKIQIPSEPGVYLMRDSEDAIIYIGKAKNLKNRVRSYFVGTQDNYKTQRLVAQISDIEFVVTDTEGEAFLLESNLIKRHRPRFNIDLKDQQRYTYLRISDEEYPRLLVARRTRDGRFLGRGKTFGPFVQGSSKLLTIGALRKTFQIRICKTLPKKVCLEYHLGNCEGPCEFKEAQERYGRHVAALEDVLAGKDQMNVFADKLADEMRQAADTRNFERAIEMRDTLVRIEGLQTSQKMEYVKSSDEEYLGFGAEDQAAVVMTFRMIHGVIRDSDKFFFDVVADNSFASFLYQYYTTHKIPRLILLSEPPEDMLLLESLLSERAGFRVRMTVPVRGRRKEMIDLIMKNIRIILEKRGEPAVLDLQRVLRLSSVPDVIECFDISNHGESFAVGSMSRFVGGRPDKSGYRRFRIKTVSGRDDYAMIGEIVYRRYKRVLGNIANEKRDDGDGTCGDSGDASCTAAATLVGSHQQNDGQSRLPDLVVIDGGKGQLGAAIKSLHQLGLDDLPCVSLAKAEEEIYMPGRGEPISLSRTEQSLKLLQYARDEAHRFGVAYNRTIQKNQIK